MSSREARSFGREFKLRAVQRIEAGENVSALARELMVKREVLYRWRRRSAAQARRGAVR